MSSLNFNNGGNGFCREMNGLIPSATIPSSLLGPQSIITEGYFGDENMSTLSMKLGEEVEANASSGSEKIGHTKLCVRGHWRPAEDAKLKELVAQFGPQNWNNIAEHLEGRTGKSCRLRWVNQLDPRIKRSAFSEEEEEKLLAAHKLHGNKWAMISRHFPGRTDNAVKNHWHVMMARRQREQQSCLYRKRKPTFQSPTKGLIMTFSNNNAAAAGSESTMSTTSTCTNLFLTTMPFCDQNLVQKYQASGSQIGLKRENKIPSLNIDFEKFLAANSVNMNQFNYSESKSEVSVSDSAANASIFGESENLSDKTKVSFIDFLGVGV